MSAIVTLPIKKKRGPKVRTGPCAVILQFPRPTSDMSENEKWLFHDFVSNGKSERWARALIQHLRLPCTENEDGAGVRNGITLAQFFDHLRCNGV